MKILIVDDDEATVAFMRLAFSGAGHDVTTATTVTAALQLAVDDPPDVVLTDLTFSEADSGGELGGGLALARALRACAPTSHVGLLAVSGADAPDMVAAVDDTGFDGFVSKPVDLASLLGRVDRLAEGVARRRAGERGIDHT